MERIWEWPRFRFRVPLGGEFLTPEGVSYSKADRETGVPGEPKSTVRSDCATGKSDPRPR